MRRGAVSIGAKMRAGRYNGGMRRKYLLGMLIGWALWLAIIAAAYGADASERYAPQWVKRADIPDMLATVLIVAAVPIKYGGWLLTWGDGGQPPEWVTGWPLNVAVGLILYGALGIVVAAILTRRKFAD
jgi:hypothetical protein